MINREGYISDFPRKKSSEEGDEETNLESGFAGNISTPQGPMNRMPGVGKKGGEGKVWQEYVALMKTQKAEEEAKKKEEEAKKKKKS